MESSLRILLVDDNRFDRELARWALREVTPPCEIDEAASWPDAREKATAGGVDLILLDFNLPGASGLDAMAELAGMPMAPPVIMLTGQDDVATAVATLRAGAYDYVVKAIDWGSMLARTIERVMARVRLERQLAEARSRLAAHAAELEQTVSARTTVLRAQAARIETLYLRAEEAARLKAEITANLSHELRTPLGIILGYTEMLSVNTTDGETSTMLDRIHVQADQLRRLVESLLALDRLNRCAEGVARVAFDLDDLAAELRAEADALNTERGLTLTWVRLPGPSLLEHDREKIYAIAYHLVSNALKFTPEGRVEMTVAPRTDGGLLLQVTDTGIGLPPEARANAFDDFRQLDGTTTRRYSGLGLGLGIVRRYTTLLGGTISVDDTPGGGTTVIVELPPLAVRPAVGSA